MAGSFDLTSAGATGPLSVPVSAPYVFLYEPGGSPAFRWLPNVVYLGGGDRVGPSPPTATFEYIQDDALDANLDWPSRIDEIWPLDASGPYVVGPDDRLVVALPNPDGSSLYLFDGFAQIPQADVAGRSERASFAAVSVAAREYDNPISGRVQRAGDPAGIRDTSGNSDVAIDLPCRFNPAGGPAGDDGGFRPNKTPDNYDTAAADDEGDAGPIHPVFAEPGIQGRPTDQSPAYWSIADAIKYILAECNPTGQYTQYPALSTLDGLLEVAYSAADGPITPGDIRTDPLLVRDYDASNKPWPEAVAELLGYAGFLMRWDLQSDPDGNPATYLRIYRIDMLSGTPTKSLYLDEPGNSLAQGSANNVAALRLARDSNAIVNAWQVETGQRRVEISIYLAPLFQVAAGDAALASPASTTSGRARFVEANLVANNADGPTRRAYRWYGADELGEGFWRGTAKDWKTGVPFDFGRVFPPDDDGTPSYAVRYRPGLGHLAAVDSLGRPLRARLDIAFGVSSNGPSLAFDNPSITWFPVADGWRLLPDRLGIRVVAADPEDWTTGNKQLPKIAGVSWWAAPPDKINGIATNGYPPTLRLTCLIEDDLRMPISVGKRPGSPTRFARWRAVDARDHFQHTSIDPSSANFAAQGGAGPDPLVVRDDTQAADSHARALQRAHEMPPLAGSVTLPGLVSFYEVGDRIASIAGRGIQLYQNAAQSQGEIATFPAVVSRAFSCEGGFRTTLQLSDFRAERHHNAW